MQDREGTGDLTGEERAQSKEPETGLESLLADFSVDVAAQLRIFASVVENSEDFIGLCTPDMKQVFVNAAGRRMVGFATMEEVRRTHVLDYFWPEDRRLIEEIAIPALLRDGRWAGEVRFRHFVTGEPIYTAWNAFVVKDAAGRPFAWATNSPNLNRLKQAHVALMRAESALQPSEKRYRDLVDLSPDAVFIYRDEQIVLDEITERKRAHRQADAARAEAVAEKRRLEAVMEALPVGVAIIDAKGGTIRANREFERVWGGPRPVTHSVEDYVVYKAWWADSGKQVQPEQWASARAVRWGETVVGQFMEIERFDGRRAFVMNGAAPIVDSHGKIAGCAVAILDMTRQKRTEDRLRLLAEITGDLLASDQPQAIVESLCRKVMGHLDCEVFFHFLADGDENRLRLNSYAGIPEETARQFESLDFGTAICGCVARDGVPITIDHVQTSPDPRTGLIRSLGIQAYACQPLLNQGRVIGTLSFGSRTHASFSNEDLALMRAVADHVAIAMQRIRLVQSLARHAEAADAANVAKSQFLASMSHELRTPMNAILGMTELALGEAVSPAVRDYLQTAKESADMLLELLNQVLDFSRIEAGGLDLESAPFHLGRAVEQVVKSLSRLACEKGIELVCDLGEGLPERVVGDVLRLRQVVLNLVGNAIKFTAEGRVVVRVENCKLQNENCKMQIEEEAAPEATANLKSQICHLKFSVSDTGIGIAPDDQERIFAPFTQADASTTRRFGGTGLGLAISQKLVQRMGGRIWVESQPGLGSTFCFTLALPIESRAEDATASGPPGLVLLRDVPVLVVSASDATRTTLQQMLANWDMQVETASDVPGALAKIHEAAGAGRCYHLVLAEALLPGIDGFALAQWLQNEPTLVGAILLMVSATDRQNHPEQVANLAVRCVEKPVLPSSLLSAVLQSLGFESPDSESGGDDRGAVSPEIVKPLRVLLAEDTPANQKLVMHLLGRRGHSIVVAPNGEEAIACLNGNDFDLILMDVQMPVMDGCQATRAIRKLDDPIKAAVPIVAMTAHALKGDDERCIAAGMDAYLAKPVDGAELIEMVERLGTRQTTSIPSPQDGPTSLAGSGESTDERRPPVFDPEEALSRLGGDEGLLKEMIGFFFREYEAVLSVLDEGRHHRAAPELAKLAHRLKGTLVYLGATPALQSANTLEAMAAAGNVASLGPAIARLREELVRLYQALSDRPV